MSSVFSCQKRPSLLALVYVYSVMVCSTYSNLIDLAGIDTTYTMLQNWIKIDTNGVYKGNYNASKDRKEQRKMKEPALHTNI